MACNSATDYDRSILPVEAQIEVNGVTFTLSLVKNNFTATEQLEGRFTVYNGTSDTIKYNFANMQQLGFKFIDASGIVVLSKPFIVSPALSSLQLAPGNFKEYPLVTTFTNHEGVRMAPGMYILKAYLLDHNSPEVLVKIIIK
jgi:hypothetical protein